MKQSKKKIVPRKESEASAVKESQLKILTHFLHEKGYRIRREELKRGLCWRASSGACRLIEDRILFIDRRTSLEEQLVFVMQQIVRLELAISEEVLSQLLPEYREALLPAEAKAA